MMNKRGIKKRNLKSARLVGVGGLFWVSFLAVKPHSFDNNNNKSPTSWS
jgi:hypothetical protein